MTLLTNLISLAVACITFLSFSSFGVVLSEIPKADPRVKSAKNNPVWKIGNSFGKGVGFFVDSHRFVTSFETASLILTDDNINSIVLSQDGDSTVKVKRLLALSAYGLALFETEPVESSLSINETLPDPKEELLIRTYSEGEFTDIKKRGNVFFSKSDLYSFPVYQSVSLLMGVKGSPVLNKQEDIVGVVLYGNLDIAITLKSIYLKKFIAGDLGLDCSGFNKPKECIRAEMDNLKGEAYKGHALSQFLLALMYFEMEENHWWIEWNRKSRYKKPGDIVFLSDKQIDYREEPSLIQRNNMEKRKRFSLFGKEAYGLMSSAAEQGLPEAQISLADLYRLDNLTENLKGIFYLVSEAAEQGFYIAQLQKAFMHLYGDGTDKDVQKALEWMNKAADQDFIPALLKLAHFLETGRDGIKREPKKVVEYLTRAADLGSPEAEYRLAEILFIIGDRGVEKDPKKAQELMTRSADKGYVLAQYDLGMMHLYGSNGVEKNPLKAYKWINAAAKQGFTEAQRLLPTVCSAAWH